MTRLFSRKASILKPMDSFTPSRDRIASPLANRSDLTPVAIRLVLILHLAVKDSINGVGGTLISQASPSTDETTLDSGSSPVTFMSKHASDDCSCTGTDQAFFRIFLARPMLVASASII